ncbi:Imm8 family immunity protein [Mesorhizobium sp. M0808]|uniref:Imm8 family immunity protein n=1 Tax=Mesorhizobium sp. M0808 TaxID=2957002 RepID=UPI00333CD64B
MSTSKHHKIRLRVAFGTSVDLPSNYQVIDLEEEEGYEAPDPSDVVFQLSLDIGIEGSNKTDIFQCVIATERNRRLVEKEPYVIVLKEYRYDAFRKAILNIIKSCEAETWYDCLSCLRRHFLWEYEGMYREEDLKKMN